MFLTIYFLLFYFLIFYFLVKIWNKWMEWKEKWFFYEIHWEWFVSVHSLPVMRPVTEGVGGVVWWPAMWFINYRQRFFNVDWFFYKNGLLVYNMLNYWFLDKHRLFVHNVLNYWIGDVLLVVDMFGDWHNFFVDHVFFIHCWRVPWSVGGWPSIP